MAMTVSEVARLAKVSVRTLHHYDELGILSPAARSEAGYRLYDDGDLDRLQEILFFKELGFRLDEIADLVSDPAIDRATALRMQQDLLIEKTLKLEAMLAAVERELEALEAGNPMDKEEMFEVFGDFDPDEYEDEVKERWGDTEAYRESARRTRRYTKADWERIKAEGTKNLEDMIALFDEGVAPDDPRAMDVADAARLQIDRNFYTCSYEMHVGLGEMYVADPRFTKYYDQHREGLAEWFRQAIRANAARAKG